uniref:Serpin domain-containing protein n=1 Tax=Scleropages formosus TaxID=113540 RepID=A0A8C9V0W8_SCLFO
MWFSVVVAAVLLGLVVGEPVAKQDPTSLLSDSTTSLGLSLYHSMVNDASLKSENVLLSPVVVASSLGVMALGARQNTASQVKSLLNVKMEEDKLHASLSELLRDVSDDEERTINWKINSRLYGPSWSKLHYRHDHGKINFRDKRNALLEINKWAEGSTKSKVPEVIKSLPGTEGAVFINIMVFKPHWAEAFGHNMVDNRGFMISRHRTASVQMMHRTGFYRFFEDEANQLQFLEIPLGQNQTSLMILMPFHVEPLERLEKMLTKENLRKWSEQLREQAVAVSLPIVDLNIGHELQKHLEQLGLVEAVDKSKADFSGITGKKDLHLSSFLQATALEITTGGNPFDEHVFGRKELQSAKLSYADHPFIFFVQDKKTGSVLLIGRLLKSSSEENHDEL